MDGFVCFNQMEVNSGVTATEVSDIVLFLCQPQGTIAVEADNCQIAAFDGARFIVLFTLAQ